MAEPVTMALAVGAGGALLNYFSTQNAVNAQKEAASKAEQAQKDALQAQLEQQQKMYDQTRQDLDPWRQKGGQALDLLSTLLGANGPEAQASALSAFTQDPTYQALVGQGEQGVLRSASATGQLRSGGAASAVAQVAPSILAQAISQRIAQLSGLSQEGLAASGQDASALQSMANANSNAHMNYANQMSPIYNQQGQLDSINPLLNSLGYGLGFLSTPGGIGGANGVSSWLSSLLTAQPTQVPKSLSSNPSNIRQQSSDFSLN